MDSPAHVKDGAVPTFEDRLLNRGHLQHPHLTAFLRTAEVIVLQEKESALSIRYGDPVDARRPISATLTYPKGGRQAWAIVLSAFCAIISVFSVINTTAVFKSYFTRGLLWEHSTSEIGWIFSIYLFMLYFIRIFTSPVFNQYRHHGLVAMGSAIMTVSLMLLSVCKGGLLRALHRKDAGLC